MTYTGKLAETMIQHGFSPDSESLREIASIYLEAVELDNQGEFARGEATRSLRKLPGYRHSADLTAKQNYLENQLEDAYSMLLNAEENIQETRPILEKFHREYKVLGNLPEVPYWEIDKALGVMMSKDRLPRDYTHICRNTIDT